MLTLPSSAEPIFMSLSGAFSDPTFRHVVILTIGAILTRGPHTMTAILRTVQSLAPGHFSTYHRVLSRAVWSPWTLQCAVARVSKCSRSRKIPHCIVLKERE